MLLPKIFDNHLLSTYNCPRKGYYTDVLGLQPEGEQPELLRGIFVHDVAEQAFRAYRRGVPVPKIMEVVMQYMEMTWPLKEDTEKITKESTFMAVTYYLLKMFNKFRPTDFYIIEEQISFMVGEWVYICNIDTAIRQATGAFSARDLKTTRMPVGDRYRDFWALQSGIMGYAIGLQQHAPNIPIEMYVIDALHIRLLKNGPEIEHKEYPFLLTQERQNIWWAETEQRMKDVVEIREGRRMPCMNTSCCFEFNRKCSYFRLCEKGLNEETLKGFYKARWNPVLREMAVVE